MSITNFFTLVQMITALLPVVEKAMGLIIKYYAQNKTIEDGLLKNQDNALQTQILNNLKADARKASIEYLMSLGYSESDARMATEIGLKLVKVIELTKILKPATSGLVAPQTPATKPA